MTKTHHNKTITLTETEIHALRLAVLDRQGTTYLSEPKLRRVLRALDEKLTDLALHP